MLSYIGKHALGIYTFRPLSKYLTSMRLINAIYASTPTAVTRKRFPSAYIKYKKSLSDYMKTLYTNAIKLDKTINFPTQDNLIKVSSLLEYIVLNDGVSRG